MNWIQEHIKLLPLDGVRAPVIILLFLKYNCVICAVFALSPCEMLNLLNMNIIDESRYREYLNIVY